MLLIDCLIVLTVLWSDCPIVLTVLCSDCPIVRLSYTLEEMATCMERDTQRVQDAATVHLCQVRLPYAPS